MVTLNEGETVLLDLQPLGTPELPGGAEVVPGGIVRISSASKAGDVVKHH